ncbi:MAG: tyrosine recombinase XerC [Holosporaceae bacterium]|jgi:integrase/recombinase XerC|nr:tyrosine recombinase XerC [Holosporaceae bacterium]
MTEENLERLTDDWLEELKSQRRYSAHTVVCYGRDLLSFKNFFRKHCGEEPSVQMLRDLKIHDFRAWLSFRISDGLSARSNARALSAVKSFFRHLARRNLLDLKAIDSLRRPKLPSLLPKPIGESVILDFLELDRFFPDEPSWMTDRDRALYTLLYCTGLRINEALSIKTRDVAPEMRILTKGRKDRLIMLMPVALERVKTYISNCPHPLSAGFLFVGMMGRRLQAAAVDIRLRKLCFIHGLPDHISAHSFRHSFATHLIQNGADLRSVQELLGHQSLSSTQIYTDMDDHNILRIYEKTHPLEKH